MVKIRLSVMMFMQFFVWGSWFVTLGLALGVHGFPDEQVGSAYGSAPIAAIIAPLFLGLVADRFFASERVMGILFLLGAVFMALAYHYALEDDGQIMVWMLIGHMICYMPSLALSNTITFSNISDQNDFPRIRVWGTIGWIVAGLFVGFMGWSTYLVILCVAAISSLCMGLYCFTLPHTPPPAKGKPIQLRTLFMLDAIRLLSRFPFMVFIISSTLICIPLSYYFGITAQYLGNVGLIEPVSSMTIGQMSEILFMLLVPFFFRRLGVKNMIFIGMIAWVTRYALFSFSAENPIAWVLFLAIALHGICYDFFFVTGFMYTDKVATNEVRGQAQSMLIFFTQGVGMYFGYMVAFHEKASTVTHFSKLTEAIKANRGQEAHTFWQSLTNMFSFESPKVNPTLFAETMAQWKTFWLTPTVMSAGIAIMFLLFFWERIGLTEKSSVTQQNPPLKTM